MIDILNNILADLSCYKRDKDILLISYINERLNKSLHTYYNDLTTSVNYLKYKDGKKVLDKMNR